MNDNITEEDKTPVAGFNRDDGDMESAENGGVAMPAAPDGEAPPAAGAAGDSDLQEENAVPADISLENTGPERELDDARIAELLANPMFIRFARGRSGGLETVCREFEEMLALGGKVSAPRMAAPIAAKLVPASSSATPDVALNERQRAIARTAGMSYREYYELISELPGSNHQNYKGE